MTTHTEIATILFSQALESKSVSLDLNQSGTPFVEMTETWPWLKLPWVGKYPQCNHEAPPFAPQVLDVVLHLYHDHDLPEPEFLKWVNELEGKSAGKTLKSNDTPR